MRSFKELEEMKAKKIRPYFTLIKDIKRMSLIFNDTEDLYNVSKLFLDNFSKPVILDDERGMIVKILSYKNGFSGLERLGGD